MPSRILRDGIIESRAVNQLSDGGEIFYRRLMSIVDDYGRFEADPEILRARLFWRILDRWPLSRVSEALTEASEALTDDGHPLLTVYCRSSRKYLQINNFDQRIRAEKSRWPSPDGHLSALGGSRVDPSTHTSSEKERTTTPEVSQSAKDRPNASEGNYLLAEIDDQWKNFCSTYELSGKSLLPSDFQAAFHAWRILDFEQKSAAIAGVVSRMAQGLWADPQYIPLPINYLRKHEWKRKVSPRKLTRDELIEKAIQDA